MHHCNVAKGLSDTASKAIAIISVVRTMWLLVQSHRESNTVTHLLRNNKNKGKIKSECFTEIPSKKTDKFPARSHLMKSILEKEDILLF